MSNTVFAKPQNLEMKDTKLEINLEKRISNGWKLENNQWYHYKNNVVQTGWISEGYDDYYMDPSTGAMTTGWIFDGYDHYYMSPVNGLMQTGWTHDGYNWYYLRRASGVMQTGWIWLDYQWYYLNSDGAMQTGWLQTDNQWYYLNSSGAMQTNTVLDGWNIWENGIATKSNKFYTGTHVKGDLADLGFKDIAGELIFSDEKYGYGKIAGFSVESENVDMIFTLYNDLTLLNGDIRRFCNTLIWGHNEILYNAITSGYNQTLTIGGRTVTISVGEFSTKATISPVIK